MEIVLPIVSNSNSTFSEKSKAVEDKVNSLILDFKNLENRKVRVTPSSSNITSYAFSPDGTKMYYMAVYEDKYNVWSLDTRTKEVKSLAKTNSGSGTIELSNMRNVVKIR